MDEECLSDVVRVDIVVLEVSEAMAKRPLALDRDSTLITKAAEALEADNADSYER